MDLDQYFCHQKQVEFDRIYAKYRQNTFEKSNSDSINWETFNANQQTNQEQVVTVSNNDFKNGTLRVRYPCVLKLAENIQFNPNRPETWLDENNNVTGKFAEARKLDPQRNNDWMPNNNIESNKQYFEGDVKFAYGLGFFAALTIETCNTIVDLNGFTLSQHPEHALQQRFYANIELADQPFIPFQGPSNFGAVLKSAKNVLVTNGKIGLSSHHGIHGNNCDNIMMKNLVFENFEVASVSLNGSSHIHMDNVNVVKNRQDVPVLGTFSAARFIKLFVECLKADGHPNLDTLTNGAESYYEKLKYDVDDCFNCVIFNNGTVNELFKNPSGLIDGNPYGIVINTKGVAVGGFLNDRLNQRSGEVCELYMNNCSVNNIVGKVNEIVALSDRSGNKAQVDTAGAVLQFFNGVSRLENEKYYYNGTVLSDVQIELAKIKLNTATPYKFGTLNIDRGIIDWRDNNGLYFAKDSEKSDWLQLFNEDGTAYKVNDEDVKYRIICNGDTMFHVNKGVIGVRLDGIRKCTMTNCSLTNVSNLGNKGSTLGGNYVSTIPGQTSEMIGYTGSDTYGIVTSGVCSLKMNMVEISNVNSDNGTVKALCIQNNSNSVSVSNLTVTNVTAGIGKDFNPTDNLLPNKPQNSIGVHVSPNCNNVKFDKTVVNNVSSLNGSPYHYKYNIQSL